jgi:secreted trypsin-like serine protease
LWRTKRLTNFARWGDLAILMHALVFAFALLLFPGAPVSAFVGGATEMRDTGAGRHIVMIISTRGNFCTGTALARNLVLTAGHCVAPAATYRVLIDQPPGIAISRILVHPRYNPKDYAGGRVTADLALVKLDSPLPDRIVPASLADPRTVVPGEHFVVAGYGVTTQGTAVGGGVPRAATLVATGTPGSLQIRLVDPVTRGDRSGLGACTGDSGAPAFDERSAAHAIIGVVSWSTGPRGSEGCGGLTGITPLARHREWIIQTAKKMGSAF